MKPKPEPEEAVAKEESSMEEGSASSAFLSPLVKEEDNVNTISVDKAFSTSDQ